MPSRSTPLRKRAQYISILDTVESSSILLNLLAIAGDGPSQTFFIDKLLAASPGAFNGLIDNRDNYFQGLVSWVGKSVAKCLSIYSP